MVLTIGGSEDYDKSWATNNAHVFTLGKPGTTPNVQPAGEVGAMHRERVFHTSVVLPDGKVFIAGGPTFGVAFNEENVQFAPELYDPETNTFTELTENNIVRVYHTVSLLLPDGRVLTGGGGLCGNCSANHYDAQIFTPPYFLTDKGELRPRPEITERLPPSILVGKNVFFSANGDIRSASLVRLGSVTHSVNTDQRRLPLTLKRNTLFRKWSVAIPKDPGIVIPGYWMLFVMDANGTPSIAKAILITSDEKALEENEYNAVRVG